MAIQEIQNYLIVKYKEKLTVELHVIPIFVIITTPRLALPSGDMLVSLSI